MVKKYEDTNKSLQSHIDIDTKMQIYLSYLEYKVRIYRQGCLAKEAEASGDSVSFGDYVDSRTPEELQAEVDLGAKLTNIN